MGFHTQYTLCLYVILEVFSKCFLQKKNYEKYEKRQNMTVFEVHENRNILSCHYWYGHVDESVKCKLALMK